MTLLSSHKSKQMKCMVIELLQLRWADQGGSVVEAYKKFTFELGECKHQVHQAGCEDPHQ